MIFTITYMLVLVARNTDSENRAQEEHVYPSAFEFIPQILAIIAPRMHKCECPRKIVR